MVEKTIFDHFLIGHATVVRFNNTITQTAIPKLLVDRFRESIEIPHFRREGDHRNSNIPHQTKNV
jgi:hypothetical protein